ncbi:hypothetical protein Tco_0536459 [Tanacetum coccineum]
MDVSIVEMERGLREGDPLSLMLFNLAADGSNILVEKAKSIQLFEGEGTRKNKETVSMERVENWKKAKCETDEWIEGTILKLRFPRIFELSVIKDGTISDFG